MFLKASTARSAEPHSNATNCTFDQKYTKGAFKRLKEMNIFSILWMISRDYWLKILNHPILNLKVQQSNSLSLSKIVDLSVKILGNDFAEYIIEQISYKKSVI